MNLVALKRHIPLIETRVSFIQNHTKHLFSFHLCTFLMSVIDFVFLCRSIGILSIQRRSNDTCWHIISMVGPAVHIVECARLPTEQRATLYEHEIAKGCYLVRSFLFCFVSYGGLPTFYRFSLTLLCFFFSFHSQHPNGQCTICIVPILTGLGGRHGHIFHVFQLWSAANRRHQQNGRNSAIFHCAKIIVHSGFHGTLHGYAIQWIAVVSFFTICPRILGCRNHSMLVRKFDWNECTHRKMNASIYPLLW